MSATEQGFKDFFDRTLAADIARRLAGLDRAFDRKAFAARVGDLDPLPMKGRVKRISQAMRESLCDDYPQALAAVVAAFAPDPASGDDGIRGFPVWVATQFVEDYGLEHFEPSMRALYALTQRFTAEFAVRPFLVAQPQRTLDALAGWRADASADVRRLVSEGSRPRLPWGLRLQSFVEDPTPVLALIEPLTGDESEYVRRSVANNLNDIAKDHPERVVEFCEAALARHPGSAECAALVRHACRTLIKQGHAGAMRLQGYSDRHEVEVIAFEVSPGEIGIGDSVQLQAQLRGDRKRDTRLVIDYAIHFQKKSGVHRKVFKWSNRSLGAGQPVRIVKNHAIAPVTIRSYYSGIHRIELLVNGRTMAQASFRLRA